MKTFTANGLSLRRSPKGSEDPVRDFQEHFTRAMRVCVKHGFTVEESFGMIWEETLEEVGLAEHLQPQVYEDLILWAKRWKKETLAPRRTHGVQPLGQPECGGSNRRHSRMATCDIGP